MAWQRSTLNIYRLTQIFLLQYFDRLPSDDSGSEFEGYMDEDEDVYASDEIEQLLLNTSFVPHSSPVVDI